MVAYLILLENNSQSMDSARRKSNLGVVLLRSLSMIIGFLITKIMGVNGALDSGACVCVVHVKEVL